MLAPSHFHGIPILGDTFCEDAFNGLQSRIGQIKTNFHLNDQVSFRNILVEPDRVSKTILELYGLSGDVNGRLIVACDRELPNGKRFSRFDDVLLISLAQIVERDDRVDRSILLAGYISLAETNSIPEMWRHQALSINDFSNYVRSLGQANENRYRRHVIAAFERTILLDSMLEKQRVCLLYTSPSPRDS